MHGVVLLLLPLLYERGGTEKSFVSGLELAMNEENQSLASLFFCVCIIVRRYVQFSYESSLEITDILNLKIYFNGYFILKVPFKCTQLHVDLSELTRLVKLVNKQQTNSFTQISPHPWLANHPAHLFLLSIMHETNVRENNYAPKKKQRK
jgi:hypothetical protein